MAQSEPTKPDVSAIFVEWKVEDGENQKAMLNLDPYECLIVKYVALNLSNPNIQFALEDKTTTDIIPNAVKPAPKSAAANC